MKPSSDQIRMQRWWTLQHKIEKNIVKIPHWMAFFNYKKVSEPLTWIFSSNENPAWNKTLRGFELTVGLYPDVAVVNVYDTHSARSSAAWSSYDTLMSQRSPLSENEIENFLNSVFNTEHIIVRKTQPNRYHSRALNAHIRKEIAPYQWVLLDQSDVARQAKQVIAHQAWKNSLGADTVKPSK